MRTETTKRRLRKACATLCALSLAGSLAFPLAALAQTEDTPADPATEQQTLPPETIQDELVEAEPETDAVPTEDRSEHEDSIDQAIDVVATEPQEAEGADVVKEAAIADPADLQRSGQPSENIEAKAVDYVRVWMRCPIPAEYAAKHAGALSLAYCGIPSGMSFAEAKDQDAFESSLADTPAYFFTLGSDTDVAVGAAIPAYPGFTFQGWIDTKTGSAITEDTPIVASGERLELVASMKKDGSNVSFFSNTPSTTNWFSVEGQLAGANVPAGASLSAVVDDIWDAKPYYDEFGAESVMGPAEFSAIDVSLFADGQKVSDKFGTLKINLFDTWVTSMDDVPFRVWHKHADGTITHEDTKLVDGILTITATDLSVFGYGPITESSLPGPDTPSGDDKPDGDQNVDQPAGDNQGNGGQAGDKQPGQGNGDNQQGGGNDQQNGDQKQEGDKKDDGKKGGNAPKTGGLAKTGDDMRFTLAGTMALMSCAAFFGGAALLMSNRRLSMRKH